MQVACLESEAIEITTWIHILAFVKVGSCPLKYLKMGSERTLSITKHELLHFVQLALLVYCSFKVSHCLFVVSIHKSRLNQYLWHHL